MFKTMEYTASFFRSMVEYPKHFDEFSVTMEPYERKEVKNMFKGIRKKGYIPFVIQDIVENIADVRTPIITNNLAADFALFIRKADNILDKSQDDINMIKNVFYGNTDDLTPKWKILGNWLDCIHDNIGKKYEGLKKIAPKAIRGLELERNGKTKEEILEATRISGEVCVDVNICLIEAYSGKKLNENLKKGLHNIYYAGNLYDDMGDMIEDYGVKKTYPIMMFNEFRKTMPFNEAKKKTISESNMLSRKVYEEGLKLVDNKREYKFLNNLLKMYFLRREKRNLRKLSPSM